MTQTEALKLARGILCAPYHDVPLDDVLEAIDKALAQPEQEPVFWYKPYPNGMYNGPIHNAQIGDVLRGSEEWTPLYTTPPQQELVCVCGAVWEGQELIYTTPQRTWVGLTPQERDEINEQVYGAVPHHVAFHAAIEAKLKEKNT